MVPLPGNRRTSTTRNLADQLATITAQLDAILASLRDDVEKIKVQMYGADHANDDAYGDDGDGLNMDGEGDDVQEQIPCEDPPVDIKKLDKTDDVNIIVNEKSVKGAVEKDSLRIIEEEKKDVSETDDYSPPFASISAVSSVSASKLPFLFAVASLPPVVATLQPMTTKLPPNHTASYSLPNQSANQPPNYLVSVVGHLILEWLIAWSHHQLANPTGESYDRITTQFPVSDLRTSQILGQEVLIQTKSLVSCWMEEKGVEGRNSN